MLFSSAEKVQVVKQVARPEIIFAAARRPLTSLVYFGGSDMKVHSIDLSRDRPEVKDLGGHESYVTGLALAGPHLVSGSYDRRLIWWDPQSGKEVRRVDAHSKWIRRVVATPDGSIIASVADDMVCRIWDAATGRLRHELRGHSELTPHDFPSMLFACAISCDGRLVATGDKIGHVNVWDIESGVRVAELSAPGFYTWDPVQRRHSIGGIRALAFSPDGSRLAIGGIGKIGNIDHLDGKPRVEVFDWRKGQRLGEVQGEGRAMIERLEFHPDAKWLLGAGGYTDGVLLFCEPDGKRLVSQEKAPMYVHDFELDEEMHTLFAVGHHKIATLTIGDKTTRLPRG
jgi:WD40 repeat protein